MSNPEQLPGGSHTQELDPAMKRLYEQLAEQMAGPTHGQEIHVDIPDAATQAAQKAEAVASKRHLVADAYAAVERVHVPTGERMTLDGRTQTVDAQTLAEQAAKSQPIPDESNQGRKRLLHNMGVRVKDRAEKLGIKSKISGRQQEQDALMRVRAGSETAIATQAGSAKELDITQASRQEWVENKIVGEELIRGLATAQRMTPEMYQQMTELYKDDPARAEQIWQGVQYFQTTGNINRYTAHDAGKASERLAA